MSITNYEDYCEAFRGTEQHQYEAELLLTMRDWFIQMGKSVQLDTETWDLDSLLCKEPYFSKADTEHKKDALSRILDESFDAFQAISVHMRENILRENVRLPVHKVREMNRYGMMWLSRRPGRTIREKASGTNSIMAVRRRMTLDTGENRLFMEFLRQVSAVLQDKLDSLPRYDYPGDEVSMLRQIQTFLRNNDFDEIRPWGNLPPNNTLLSDQNYRKIWRGWSSLKQIDDLIEQDDHNLPERMCTVFFVELLKYLRKYGYIPQLPVSLDYTNFQLEIRTFGRSIPVLGANGIIRFDIRQKMNMVEIQAPNGVIRISFERETIHFRVGSDITDYPLTERGMHTCIQDILASVFDENEQEHISSPTLVKQREVIIDLFALHPRFYSADGNVDEVSGRLLYQNNRIGDEEFELPCDTAQAIYLSKDMTCYTVRSSLEKGDLGRLARLAHLLEKYIDTRKLTFVYPDVYTNLQVSLLYKSARMAYPEVHSLPRSIGAAFSWQKSDHFSEEFEDGSFLLSVDLVGDDLTFTLVRGNIDPQLGEIVWERHPTGSISIYDRISELLQSFDHNGCVESEILFELFGFDGMKRETGKLAFLSPEEDSGWQSFVINQGPFSMAQLFPIEVGKEIEQYLFENRRLINGSKVYIQVFSPFIMAHGNWKQVIADHDDALLGCKYYQNMQAESVAPLWCDYLPKLSIKLLYGDFPLIQQVRVSAQYGERVRIPIDNVFTLPHGKQKYQFDLIQRETSKSTSFIAEVRSNAFPLERDTRCNLEMWYQYGAETPFTLTFLPCETEHAPFKQAMVSWLPRSQVPYPVDDLPVPGFPQTSSWQELSQFVGKNNDLIDIPRKAAGIMHMISDRYYTIDLGQIPYAITGQEGKRHFTVVCDLDGTNTPVEFNEAGIERIKQRPQINNFAEMGIVSFNLKKRYTAQLTPGSYGKVWFVSRKGGYQHFENNWYYNGQEVTVAFFSSEFTSQFDQHIHYVTFELRPYGPDDYGTPRYKAVNICDAYHDDRQEKISANLIRPGNTPPDRIVNGYCHFLFHTIYFGGKSVYEADCPEVLRTAFESAKDEWIRIYERCDNPIMQLKLFNLMSLAAGDLGNIYYQIANRKINDYQRGICKLPDNIGYSLCTCEKDRETELLEHILELKDEKVVCILSKAIWGNPRFIFHFPLEIAFKYFDVAVKYVGSLIIQWEKKQSAARYKLEENLNMCFEYVLGIFRMRQLSDDRIKWKLSMNNDTVRKLYKWTERAIEDGIQIKTFLNLSISDKKQYENVPDLLYALLVYITGREEGDSIQISSIDFETE